MRELPNLPLERQLVSILKQNREDSFATQRKRGNILGHVARMLHEKYGLQKWANLKAKHVGHVVETWKRTDAGRRAIEEKMSHLRWLVRKIGKANLVPRSNLELGIEPGPRYTRAGKMISDDRFREFLERMDEPRLRMALKLGRHLGMRFREAMLFRPHRDFDGKRVWLRRGTKGGRPRYLYVHSEKQVEVIREARSLVTGDQNLVPREYTTFEKWRQHCYRLLRAAEMGRATDSTFHDLRRTYAMNRMDYLMQKGRSSDQAARLVARELGHGRTEVLAWYISNSEAA